MSNGPAASKYSARRPPFAPPIARTAASRLITPARRPGRSLERRVVRGRQVRRPCWTRSSSRSSTPAGMSTAKRSVRLASSRLSAARAEPRPSEVDTVSLPDRGQGSAEQLLGGLVALAQDVADLAGRQSRGITQRDRLALDWWKAVDSGKERGSDFIGEDTVLRRR